MKKFKKIFGFIGICLAFVFFLASCSNVSKDYADKINNAYKNQTTMKYDDVKKDLGDECLDLTTNQNGLLIAVKGIKAVECREKLANAKPEDRFEFISVTVIVGNCTYALYANATAGEILASINSQNIN